MPLTAHLPRLLTGGVLLIALGTALCVGGAVLYAFLLFFSCMGLWELYAMFWSGSEHFKTRLFGVLLGALFITMVWLHPHAAFAALSGIVVCLLIFFLCAWANNTSTSFFDTALLAAGLVYVPVLLVPVLEFSLLEQLLLVGITAFSDTAAYFCGMRFGKHKIWPKISPKKSIEGSLAGLLACTVFACLMILSFGTASLIQAVGLALVLGMMAQLGDFFESALKRSKNIKDSGFILPGHGGVLDRADSLLFVIPTYACAKAFWTFF